MSDRHDAQIAHGDTQANRDNTPIWTTTMRRRYWRLRNSGLSHDEAVTETEHPTFSKTAKGFDK